MSRYTGPKMRKVRALGEEFAMQGDRSLAAKFVKLHRKQAPGMHGKKKTFKKMTGYGQQLQEKQKARVFYHLTEKQLVKYYQQATSRPESTDLALLVGLERRLDNVVYRAGFANSHPAARQLVSHGHFTVNGRRADVPSITIKPGDKIEFTGKRAALKEKIAEVAASEKPVSWIAVDNAKLSAQVTSLPTREEILVPFNEKLIVEFYSK
ncbi:MAG: 30S ribosomal protein S4 [Patescibacteria group bacterium]